ncbi:MAG: N-acetylmuramoyl-L-alanine amidase [Desulfitobacteriaceae bacterium]
MWRSLKLFFVFFITLTIYLSIQIPAIAEPLAYPTSRIFGTRQIDTAIEVSKAGWQQHADTILLANAYSFPDALVAAPLSHRLDAPVLLTTAEGVDDQVMAEIKRLGANRIILLGGEAVLGPQVIKDLQTAGFNADQIERIAGYDRYETAAKVAERVGVKGGQVILVNGEQFPDALAVSSYAGVTETPIFLTNARTMPEITLKYLQSFQVQAMEGEGGFTIIVVGGEAVVPGKTLTGFNDNVNRLAGADRYATAAQVYLFAHDTLNSDTAYLVSGENFPDALVAGALAAKNQAGIFMSERESLPAVTYSVLGTAAQSSSQVVIIGGKFALADQVKGMVEGTIQPKYLLAGVTVAVDPGHGGKDTGAIGVSGSLEKNNNLQVSLYLADLLRGAGANVIMTRSTDTTPTGSKYSELPDLEARVKIANTAKADLFVSIHNDSFSNPNSNGTTTYYSSDSPFAAKSLILGQKIQAQVVKTIELSDRGVRDAGFYVTRHTTMPAVLVELGFLSNPSEEKLLGIPDFQKKAALGIYRGILTYRGY